MSTSDETPEPQLFAPLVIDAQGHPNVQFPLGHPGHGDEHYKQHRDRIAVTALEHRVGDPVPPIGYRPEDDQTWQYINAALSELIDDYAASEILEARRRLALPVDHVPQLSDSSDRISELSGFRFVPAAGIVPLREFYGSFADRIFNATQYIRHESNPLFSPEPDMVHEVLGHGTTLASPRLAELYVQAGVAARRMETEAGLEAVSRVFWFTLEYGLLWEQDSAVAYGASLLSSCGELQNFRRSELRPLDAREMITQAYDVTDYQPVLFAAESLSQLEDFLGEFFATADDNTPALLTT